MDFSQFLDLVPQIKKQPLLAHEAHRLMVPEERLKFLDRDLAFSFHPRESAVLMLIYPKDNQTHLLLIERASYPGIHSSQIAFPGGKKERIDANLQQTALRETQEEVGLAQDKVQVIKPFSGIYIPPSNFWVAPYLGMTLETPHFVLQANEVAQIIEMPLGDLFSNSLVDTVRMTTSYATDIEVPAFIIQQHVVWGATAMILSELKETLIKAGF